MFEPYMLNTRYDLAAAMEQKSQGQWGTCHAFALTPSIELHENKKLPQDRRHTPYRVSENWIVFVSLLDRMCGGTNEEVKINQGWNAGKNMKRLLKMGYCSKPTYIPYDASDLSKSIRTKSESSPLEVFKDFESELGAPQAKGLESKGLSQRTREKFKETFGVSVQQAEYLCNPGNVGLRMEKLLNSLPKTSNPQQNEFASCLKEAIQKRKELKEDACETTPQSTGSAETTKRSILSELKEGRPVIVGMKNYPKGEPVKEHGAHSFNIIGYDPKNDEFKVANSWGANGNHPVPGKAIGNIFSSMTMVCDKAQYPKQSAASMLGSNVFEDYSQELDEAEKRRIFNRLLQQHANPNLNPDNFVIKERFSEDQREAFEKLKRQFGEKGP